MKILFIALYLRRVAKLKIITIIMADVRQNSTLEYIYVYIFLDQLAFSAND